MQQNLISSSSCIALEKSNHVIHGSHVRRLAEEVCDGRQRLRENVRADQGDCPPPGPEAARLKSSRMSQAIRTKLQH